MMKKRTAKATDEKSYKLDRTPWNFNQNIKSWTFRDTKLKYVYRLTKIFNFVTRSGGGEKKQCCTKRWFAGQPETKTWKDIATAKDFQNDTKIEKNRGSYAAMEMPLALEQILQLYHRKLWWNKSKESLHTIKIWTAFDGCKQQETHLKQPLKYSQN